MHQHTSEHPRDSGMDREQLIVSGLMIRSCSTCGVLLSPQSSSCSFCGTFDLDRVPSSGVGWIVSWKIVHRATERLHEELTPSIIAVIELDDGPWVFSEIDGAILPPSDRRVRAHFSGRHVDGRYPVFVLDPAHRPNSRRKKSSDEMDDSETWRLAWVRSSLHQCDLLVRSRSVNVQAKSLIKFAIRWAPFGGADPNELLVTFGVSRERFIRLMKDALCTQGRDNWSARSMKSKLLAALLSMWNADPHELRTSRSFLLPSI
ncbi:Zn-ribbon domain-containing OB-fold protein [Nocardia salmonicida]|uniref:Zn-ribbon domain-containing OB-fold protein n=1 Tax=Nocardia salmonicida TaxID=53431 RepID=UPI00366D72E6